ncbi:nicotinate-nucleotide--dimethylbenzimidazole phosphoribosyltransferase [Aquabacterium humicola]|uniref:nicotinate-nucleotide--dimethylbenzimidazole phosphoribosyltransferase n=1 Tax=Aquabacterium humicola TaxID=3237377 RepID=UPI002542FED9|nr:nicotinate-nucleotide--dimethylbenzimidazole phosphoribosyltransferase [Rubrivivax pictus]
MSLNRSLITPTSSPLLERALIDKLERRGTVVGSLGELEPVAVRLGLMQNTLKPRFRDPQLVLFAADHGLAVDGIQTPQLPQSHEQVLQLLTGQLPVSVFARIQGLELSVIDCGLAAEIGPHDRLMPRKIAHGTRNARVGPAMALEQAHAAIRAGMEIGDALRGNLVACAGIGVGAHEAAALVLARLTQSPVRDLLVSGPQMSSEALAHLMMIAQGAQSRHREVTDAVEVLAAFGGFETAVMVGVMLVAASKRHLIMVDGMAACAALMVASRIAASVTDYCVFCRSHSHRGLDQALNLFNATALLELGLDSIDGTGACLSWPLVRSAAALLTELADGEDPGPSRPSAMGGEPSGFDDSAVLRS